MKNRIILGKFYTPIKIGSYATDSYSLVLNTMYMVLYF